MGRIISVRHAIPWVCKRKAGSLLMLSTGLWNEVRSHSSSRPVELKSRIFNFTEVISDKKKIHRIKSQVLNYNLRHEILAAQHAAVAVRGIYTNWSLQYKTQCILHIERSVHLNTYFYNTLRVNLSPPNVLIQNCNVEFWCWHNFTIKR